MATITDFRKSVRQEYEVSDEQLDACVRWIDGASNRVFYTVESASVPGRYYRVHWNVEHHCLQCLLHNDGPCTAFLVGLPCWHKRAACASERLFKYEQAQGHWREAEAVEATAEARYEHALFDQDTAREELEAAEREHAATKRYGLKAYERAPFSLLK